MDKQKSLRACEMFRTLDNFEIGKISSEAVERGFVKGNVIFTEGEKGDYVYIVTEGLVKTSKYSLNGKEGILDIFIKGDLLEPTYVFCGDSYPYSATALSKVKVLLVRKEKIVTLMEKYPGVALQIMQNVSKRLLSAYCKLQEKNTEKVEQRIAKILLVLFKKVGNELSFTREEIANMVGTTFETVIRFTSSIKKEKILETGKRKIKIINEQKLRLIAEGFRKSSFSPQLNDSREKKLLACNA